MDYIKLVEDVVEYIEETREDLDMDSLAVRFHISKYFFSRIFKAVTEQSLIKYYRNRRLEQASESLLSSSDTILQVAIDYGYNSQEAFTRAFKTAFGITPKEYRKIRRKSISFEKINLITRKLINFNNEVLPDYEIVSMDEISLAGYRYTLPFSQVQIQQQTISKTLEFVEEHGECDIFYFLSFNSIESDVNLFSFGVYGEKKTLSDSFEKMERVLLPAADYLKISYVGNMSTHWNIVDRDVIKLLILRNLEMDFEITSGLQIYERSWMDNQTFSIFYPLKK